MAAKKKTVNPQMQNIVTAILTILLGLLFIILKGGVISIAMTILGVALIVLGVLDILRGDVLSGIIKAVLGVVVIVSGWAIVSYVLYIVAALLLIYGIYELYLRAKAGVKGKNIIKTILAYAEPVVKILIGLLLLFNQGGAIAWVFIVGGVLLVVEGLLYLVEVLAKI